MSLFVAVRPSPKAVRDLDRAVAAVRAGEPEGLRWTEPESWHLTLAFLGQVDAGRRADLEPRLDRAARRHQRMSLSLGRAGHFGSHVLFVRVSGDLHALRALAGSVGAAARRADISLDDRPYRPHLTLARSRGTTPLRPVAALLAEYAGPPWPVAEFVLMESTPSGLAGRPPTYTMLGTFPLGGPHA